MISWDELKQSGFSGEIDLALEKRELFKRDASIFEALPEAVAHPKNASDVGCLVKFASSMKKGGADISLTPSAGRTDMTGGSISESIIVDFAKYMNRIEAVQFPISLPCRQAGNFQFPMIQVQPGAFYRDMEKVTLEKNLVMPAYPVSRAICGVGGMVGNNCGGEKSLSYGQCIDYINELEVVLADGEIYMLRPWSERELAEVMKANNFLGQACRKLWHLIYENQKLIRQAKPTTSKNSAGYYLWRAWNGQKFDLTQLFCGSQGTLGVITNIQFRLVPVKPHGRTLVIFMQDLTDLGRVITAVKSFKPECFELYDDHTLRLAVKYLPEMLKKMQGATLNLLWQFLPELRMVFLGGVPKLVLLAEFTEDNDAAAFRAAREAEAIVKKQFSLQTRITASKGEAAKFWAIRRESYNLLRQHTKNRLAACFIEDICVHPEQLPEFLPRLNEIFSRYRDFIYTIAGHAGDANFHIMPLMDLSVEENRKAVERLSDEVFGLVMEYKGTIAAEHNDGIVRGPYLEKMYSPEVMELFRQVKKIFDPLNIFNPHKKIDATMEYFEKHLRRS